MKLVLNGSTSYVNQNNKILNSLLDIIDSHDSVYFNLEQLLIFMSVLKNFYLKNFQRNIMILHLYR